MTARITFAAGVLALFAATAAAQQPAPPANAPKPAPPPAATQPAPATKPAPPSEEPRAGSPINVKVDVTITDQRGNVPAVKKTVTIVTADGNPGRVRTQATFNGLPEIPLNVDVTPRILGNGRIRLGLGLIYELPVSQDTQPTAGRNLIKTAIQENLSVNLDDAKPLVVAQSADPVSDRQVIVEVRATILK
jgi:hypothetical protein